MNKKNRTQEQEREEKKPFYKRKYFSFITPTAAILIITLYISINPSAKKSQAQCSREDFAICYAKFGEEYLQMKVAYSDPVKAQGLMGVTELDKNNGMIFIYDYPQVLSFWMKDTLLPLSIAFLDANGFIVSIHEMTPEPNVTDDKLRIYDSSAPAQYAIEADKGWFEQQGVKEGDKIDLPVNLTDPTAQPDSNL